MDNALFQRMKSHLQDNEDRKEQPYKDPKGLLTVGIGFRVDSPEAFVRLPFQVKDAESGQMRDAKDSEKLAEFERINALKKTDLDQNPSRFILPEGAIDSELKAQIETRIGKIEKDVGAANWERLPDGQKVAVLDVHYANGGLDKFPTLKQAVKDGDFAKVGANVDFHSQNEEGAWIYNEGRLARNRSEAQGIPFEDAKRSVQADLKSGTLKPGYKPAKTSDASENTDQPKVTLHETGFGTDLNTTNTAALEASDIPAPKPDILGAAAQTGGLANEAAETQAAADQVKAEGAPEQTANIDSRIQSMRDLAAQPIDHPGKSALLKPVDKWNESEMKDALNSAQGDFTGWKSGDPQKARLYEAVQDWHTNTYGDGPQVLEGGKPVEPSPVKPLNIVAQPHTTPQGEDLWKASSRMGDKLGTIAETDGYEQSVKGLQRGLNILNSTQPLPERSDAWGPYTPQEALKVDGDYGPKTDFVLKDTLARHGESKADDALALGRFGNFADQVKQSGKADGLDQATKDIFGPLYGGSDAPNGVLQETLNKVGGNSIDGWQDLKVDDWIGPKTTDAFAQVMDQTDPEDFIRGFGQGLGLL